MKINIVCAPGVGDALIFHTAVYNLTRAGHDVALDTPHDFGRWLPSLKPHANPDLIFLQHDNSSKSKQLLGPSTYVFYGSHKTEKHGPLREGLDYVCDPNQTMVANVVRALQALFHIDAVPETGLTPPPGLIYQRYPKRIAIQEASAAPEKNWGPKRLNLKGLSPVCIPQFPTLEEFFSFIYESGFVLSNDSAPGHIASALKIPHLVIAQSARHMRLWRPGWGHGQVLTPYFPLPKWLRPHWRKFILTKSVVKLIIQSFNMNL